MSRRRLVALAITLIPILLITATFLFFTSGYVATETAAEPETAWAFPTLEDIYAPFSTIETDLDGYIWPTDITQTMTSAFGEFRTTHFHAGIDISTHGRIGAPVFASRSGFVERAGVSPFGYGKYLVLRHSDGYMTLYAHLDKFHDAIEERVYGMQLERNSYSIVVYFERDEFIFEQGEVIARSGATGSGPPHIHFEIRDTNDNPVNPKFSRGIAINDKTPPVFNRIAFIPVDEFAKINGSINQTGYQATQLRQGSFDLRRKIEITGTVGLAVDVTDSNNDTWYRHGIYGLEMSIGDSVVFSMRYNRFPEAHTHQVRLHYDNDLLRIGQGRFQKLFIEEGNMLPFYERLPHGSGLINTGDLDEGLHPFSVSAFDFAGNESILRGHLSVVHNRLPAVQSVERIDPAGLVQTDRFGINTTLFRDILIVKIINPDPLDDHMLIVSNGESHFRVPIEAAGNELRGRLRLRATTEPDWRVTYISGDEYSESIQTVYSVLPEEKGIIRTGSNDLTIAYEKGAVYAPLFFTISKTDSEAESYYTLSPPGIVLAGGMRIELPVPEGLEPVDRTVLYAREGSRWSTLSTHRDEERRTIIAHARRLVTDLTVAVDTIPPVIDNVIVEGNRNLRIRFRLSDDQSGIDHRSLHMKLNDDILIGRYDPDLASVIFRANEQVAPGEYDLSIDVNDRAGNPAGYRRNIIIR